MRLIISCLIFISRSALERSSERTWGTDRLIREFQPAAGPDPNNVASFHVSHLVQVVGQTVVETLHGLLVIDAVAVHAVQLQAHWPVEVLVNRD